MTETTCDFTAVREIGQISPDGVMVYHLEEEKILYANLAAFDFFGLKENDGAEAVRSVLELIRPEDRELVKSHSLAIAQKPLSRDLEFRLAAGGTDKFVKCDAYHICNGSAVVVHIRDVSQARQHDDYMVEFGARKDAVLETVTHYVSGALTLMKNLSAEAAKHVNEAENKNLATYLHLLQENSNHCLRVVTDLLDMEHKDSPKVSVKILRVNIVAITSFIYEEIHQAYPDREVVFQYPGPIFINTDDVKLLQIISNLASNAVKFSPKETPISFAVYETETHAIISVADRGIGIPDHLKPFLFEYNTRAGRTGLNGEKSHGLGLSICKKLADMMQATLSFESKVGEGSVFYVTLPKEGAGN